MAILVTSTTGFIGSHYSLAIKKCDYGVLDLVNFIDYYDPSLKRDIHVLFLKHQNLHCRREAPASSVGHWHGVSSMVPTEALLWVLVALMWELYLFGLLLCEFCSVFSGCGVMWKRREGIRLSGVWRKKKIIMF